MLDLRPLGDRAFFARFALESEARGWAEAVRARSIPGVVDVSVAYASAAVYFDEDRLDPRTLEALLREVRSAEGPTPEGRLIRLPVLYDGGDLGDVARIVDLSVTELIRCHAGLNYTVFALGFLPGFPYAGYLSEPLVGLPRKRSPRARVPAGSVAIAGRQTGIYPTESPGGWLLLGRTPLTIADPGRGFFPIEPGDRLRFEPISAIEYGDRLGEPLRV